MSTIHECRRLVSRLSNRELGIAYVEGLLLRNGSGFRDNGDAVIWSRVQREYQLRRHTT